MRHWLALLDAAPSPVGDTLPPAEPAPGTQDAQDGPDAAFALTDVQYAYWIGRQDDQVLGGVGCHAYVELDGHGVHPARLQAAWRQVFERHAMLRTRFTDTGRQYVDDALPAPVLAVHDFSALPAEAAEARALALREALSHRRLRVDAGEVAGLALSRLPQGRTRIHVDVDLLVADVQSLHILLRDLAAAYAGEAPPADPAWRFSRYLAIEAESRRPQREAARRYWQDALAELPKGPRLPLAQTPAAVGRPRFVRRSHRLTAPRWQSLRVFAAANRVTAAMVLASAYAEVLARWSGDTQFLLNMPLFDRQTEHPGIEHAVADFTNLLLLRCDCREPVSFAERAQRIQRQFHQDVAHAAYSAVAVQRDLVKQGRAEGVAAPVVFACNLGTPLLSDTCKATLGELGYMVSQTPQVWLDHQVYEDETGLLLAWDAVEDLFPAGLIDDMFHAYCGLLDRLAEDAAHWQQAPLLPLPAAQAAVREAVNRTGWAHTVQPLHAGLFAVAAETPSRPALIAGERSVSYGELAERALRVAALLRERGLSPGEPVAVSLPRGVDQLCAVFGVLAAGGCYVPVGVHQPLARQEKIHASAGIRWVLGEAAHLDDTTREGTTRLDVAEAWHFAPLAAPVAVSAEARAYLIFTSGSTGTPKGVAMTHAGAANTIDALNARYGVGEHSRVLAVSSLDFDLSVYDLFGVLGAGGAVVVLDEAQRRDAGAWLELIHRHGVTLWNSVPVLLEMLLVMAESDGRRLPFEQVFLSGDWIGLDLPARLLAHSAAEVKLVAMGGATEAGIWSNAFDVRLPLPSHWRSIPYGQPLPNQCYRVVDAQGRDCPDWVAGELWIGGAGLALGYCGDAALSAERFIERDGGRWYRTGDRGRYWPDGTLEFLGREDHQVKVRGHRIELGEIEAALNGLPQVSRAVAATVGQPAVLAAAYVPTSGHERETSEAVRTALGALLPDYMVPSTLLAVEALPLSANGKVDRKAVVALLAEQGADARLHEPPQGRFETQVAGIWREVLQCETVSRHDDFFLIGGDSLRATRIVQLLHGRRVSPAPVPLFVLFSSPTLAALAAYVRDQWQALGAVASDEEELIEEGIL